MEHSTCRYGRQILPARQTNARLDHGLARSFAAGEQSVAAIQERCARLLGRRWRWVGPVVGRYLRAFAGKVRPRQREIVRFLRADDGFLRARVRHAKALQVVGWIGDAQEMVPLGAAAGWEVPEIVSEGGLADWLGLEHGRMLWLADRKGLAQRGCGPRAGKTRCGTIIPGWLAKSRAGCG